MSKTGNLVFRRKEYHKLRVGNKDTIFANFIVTIALKA